ncbi:MAG: hypothetical protein HGGPFJEG_00211 [Ignavibacteria bacterium]|nr:hypothetical protein [Ignavibacteria bacterium]
MTDNFIRKSFIYADSDSHFPIQNIPFGIFKSGDKRPSRACTIIGDKIIDLTVLESRGFFNDILSGNNVFKELTLNKFMSLGNNTVSQIRREIQKLFDESCNIIKDDDSLLNECLHHKSEIKMCLPVDIGNYTDFYSSKEHATNVGIMFRGKENALMPNWVHLPVAYHGRASSVIISGTDIIRPKGQTKNDDEQLPVFGPSKLLDFELETGFFISKGNNHGDPIPVNRASEHIFGMVLVNDWSARDIQKWEYVPLGPFLSKNFATSISPWIVTLDALEPFKAEKIKQDPEPLPYLRSVENHAYDILLEVKIRSEKMNEFQVISKSNFKYLYWDICQQLAHHTITGCNMQSGDLLASGTISGPDKSSFGSMLELTWRGQNPIKLTSGEERKFLQDGDEICMTGYCQGDGFKVGFGEVISKILPAKS